MRSINFEGATHFFGKPEGWNEMENGPCGTLPLRLEGAVHTSVWEPSAGDLDRLNKGAKVVLTVYGIQPPVMLDTQFHKEV